MSRFAANATKVTHVAVYMLAAICLVFASCNTQSAYAAEAKPRSLKLNNANAGVVNARYQLDFHVPTMATIGSIRLAVCSNSPLLDDTCTPPTAFDISAATIISQTGVTGFSRSVPDTTANELVLTRPPSLQPVSDIRFELGNIQNPSSGGSYYARVYTYASSDGTGPYTDAGGLAFVIHPGLSASAEVPPYIKFCLGESITAYDCNTATEPFSDLGNLSPAITSAAQSQMVIATNAENGYSMWVVGTPMTSGSNVLTAMAGGPAVRNTSQFGMNLRANGAPSVGQDVQGPGAGAVTANYNTPNNFRFSSGDILATSPTPDDNRKYTVSYIVNIPSSQPGGVYSTTLVYICLANF